MPKGKLNIEDKYMRHLGIKGSDGWYIQKSGQEYIDALALVQDLFNRNDYPFTIEEIEKAPLFKDFVFRGKEDFKYICDLHINPFKYKDPSNRKNEKITAINFQSQEAEEQFRNEYGVVYIFTCVVKGKEHIVKIGDSSNTFKDRLGSYNCGVINNWRTASTTNIKLVQSMVVTRLDIKVYLCSPGEDVVYEWHGYKSVPLPSSMYRAVEDILVKEYIKQFGIKPIFNIQAKAGNINEED